MFRWFVRRKKLPADVFNQLTNSVIIFEKLDLHITEQRVNDRYIMDSSNSDDRLLMAKAFLDRRTKLARTNPTEYINGLPLEIDNSLWAIAEMIADNNAQLLILLGYKNNQKV